MENYALETFQSIMKAIFKSPLVMTNPAEQRQRKGRLGIKNKQVVPG